MGVPGFPAQVLRSRCPADHGGGGTPVPHRPTLCGPPPHSSTRAAVARQHGCCPGCPRAPGSASTPQCVRMHRHSGCSQRGKNSFHWALSLERTRAVSLVPRHLMMLLLSLLLFLNVFFSQLKYSSISTDTRPERSRPESRTDPCRTPKRSFSAAETASPCLALYSFSF